MGIVDEIFAVETAEELKKKSPEKGEKLLRSMYELVMNHESSYDEILEKIGLVKKDDVLYPIFDQEVRALMRLADSEKNRLLTLDKMLEVF